MVIAAAELLLAYFGGAPRRTWQDAITCVGEIDRRAQATCFSILRLTPCPQLVIPTTRGWVCHRPGNQILAASSSHRLSASVWRMPPPTRNTWPLSPPGSCPSLLPDIASAPTRHHGQGGRLRLPRVLGILKDEMSSSDWRARAGRRFGLLPASSEVWNDIWGLCDRPLLRAAVDFTYARNCVLPSTAACAT